MADALAQYATDLRYEDLPEDIVRTAKRTILDTLGCAFGGYTAGPSQIAIKLASKAGSNGLMQRHQDESRFGRFCQRRDDPLPRFQRRFC
jgi:2-methylcitrate dehydratase PrpD